MKDINLSNDFNIIVIATVVAIMAITWFIGRALQKSLALIEAKNNVPTELALLINKFAKYLVYTIGAITVLKKLGVEVGAILASLGVGGLALSFALKDSIANIIAGITIIIYRPYSLGDYIEFKTASRDFGGKIVGINLRYITLEKEENKTLVPNSVLIATAVEIIKK